MPYKRKYSKRPGYAACGKMVYGDAKKALNVALSVKRLINVERKFLDHVGTATAVSTTPVVINLHNMVQGITENTRTGNQIKCLRVECSYFGTIHASAVQSQLRILLIKDKQINSASYTAGDVLLDVTANDAIVSPINLDNKYRFVIYYDRVHTLSDSGNKTFHNKFSCDFNLKVRYDGNAGTVADLSSSGLSLLFFSNEATNAIAFTRSFRMYYVDN